MRRQFTTRATSVVRRLTWVASALILAIGATAAVSPTPSGAVVGGITGQVTNNAGAPVGGVAIDLFKARRDGSRGAVLGQVKTDTSGRYQLNPANGCYVITMIAPPGSTFVGANQYFQRGVCVSGGQSPAAIDAVLATGTAPTCTPGQPIWNLRFDEQFTGDGAALGSAWSPFNSVGNAGFGLRRPSAITLWGGSLNIKAGMEGATLVSGGLSHSLNQTYGRYEFRVRTDKDLTEATSGVVLTWPQSNVFPRDGENDIYETLWGPGDRHEFYSFIHKPFGTTSDQEYVVHAADASQWHTMVMEWMPDKLVIWRDGQVVTTIVETSADLIPDNPQHLSIQLDAWKQTIPSPVWLQVDYVKIWSYGGSC
jgi:Glycosyl hydrolases family 16